MQSGTRNGRSFFRDGNTAFDVYYVPSAVMIDHAWVIEGPTNSHMAIHDVDFGTWTEYGQRDEVPPYGKFSWKRFDLPMRPSVYEEILLLIEPLEHCVPTQGPTQIPTDYPTTSTPSPSAFPSIPPTATPTPNPTDYCRVLVVTTPE